MDKITQILTIYNTKVIGILNDMDRVRSIDFRAVLTSFDINGTVYWPKILEDIGYLDRIRVHKTLYLAPVGDLWRPMTVEEAQTLLNEITGINHALKHRYRMKRRADKKTVPMDWSVDTAIGFLKNLGYRILQPVQREPDYLEV